MFSKRVFSVLSLVTLLGLAACGGEQQDTELVEEPSMTTIEEPTEEIQVAPEVYEGATIMDTTTVDTGVQQ